MKNYKYFLLLNNEKKGPFNKEKVDEYYNRLLINQSSLIWREGLDSWVPLNQINDFNIQSSHPNTLFKKPPPFKGNNKNKISNYTPAPAKKNKSHLVEVITALPAAFILAFVLKSTFLRWIMWIPSMWIHELGHSISAWLTGTFMFPAPFIAPFGNPIFNGLLLLASVILIIIGFKNDCKRTIIIGIWFAIFSQSYLLGRNNLLVFSLIFIALLYQLKIGNFYNSKTLIFSGYIMIGLQILFTFFIQEKTQELIIYWSGIGGEFIISTVFIIFFNYKLPEKIRWDFFRYFFLIIGTYVFLSISMDWIKYSTDHSLLPFGTALAGSSDPHGDLNIIRDKHSWSIDEIVNNYLFLSKICVFTILMNYLYQILGLIKKVKPN